MNDNHQAAELSGQSRGQSIYRPATEIFGRQAVEISGRSVGRYTYRPSSESSPQSHQHDDHHDRQTEVSGRSRGRRPSHQSPREFSFRRQAKDIATELGIDAELEMPPDTPNTVFNLEDWPLWYRDCTEEQWALRPRLAPWLHEQKAASRALMRASQRVLVHKMEERHAQQSTVEKPEAVVYRIAIPKWTLPARTPKQVFAPAPFKLPDHVFEDGCKRGAVVHAVEVARSPERDLTKAKTLHEAVWGHKESLFCCDN